ncbi:hypothetical protein [Bradyrhizobium macuxiense]|nr:hypothetical protein [Bradyrhizobium macuxiense]
MNEVSDQIRAESVSEYATERGEFPHDSNAIRIRRAMRDGAIDFAY